MTSRNWLITGVSSGFGREMATQLLDRGDTVVGTVRRADSVADLVQKYPDTFHRELLDVTDAAAVRRIVDRSFTSLGRIDVIVSNAGYGLFGAAEEISDEQVDRIIATNLTGSIQLIRAACRTCAPRAAGGSSRSPPTAGRSPSPATRCTTPRSGESKASPSPSPRRSPRSASE